MATGVESIVEEDIQTAMNTGKSPDTIKYSAFNRESAKLRGYCQASSSTGWTLLSGHSQHAWERILISALTLIQTAWR
jgi:hypothetical protein